MSFSVKLEPDEEKSDNEAEPELVIDDDHEMQEEQSKDIKPEPKEAAQQPHPIQAAPASVSDLYSAIANAPRRCETCDIKFTYLKSYLAHKEFYCKERNNNGKTGGGAVTSSKSNAGSEGMTSPSNGGLSSAVRAAEVQ